MDQRRIDAQKRGELRYSGAECRKGHGTERYVSNGGCVECALAQNLPTGRPVGRPKKKATMSEAEVQALLARGGPNSRAMAEAAGLKWFNDPDPKSCHGLIGLDGSCPLCGQLTPEPINQELDLAERLLS